jgi:hypothetical protein
MKLSIRILLLFLTPISLSDYLLQAQQNFESFLSSAKANNSELVSLEAQKKYLTLESQMIFVQNRSPKVFLSSEYLFAPYLNNNGHLISIEPEKNAIGYDVGITNGGLYAFLLNVEYPIFNRSQVNNLLGQNACEIAKINTRIKTIEAELEHSLVILYSDALLQQLELQRARENLKLLSDELNIIKALSEHGLYRYVDYRLMAVAAKSDSIDFSNSETAYQLSLNQLKTACGIKDSTLFFLEDFKIEPTQIRTDSSIFVKEYQDDSLSALWQQKVFNNQYRPQVKLYANTGLNSTSMAYLGNHTGMSAGIQLTYTLFDGRQKEINRQQQMALIDASSNLKSIKINERNAQLRNYRQAIETTQSTLKKESELEKEYSQLLLIYTEELKKAQVSVVEFLNFLQVYNQNKLSITKHTIELNKLINEFNYWNH